MAAVGPAGDERDPGDGRRKLRGDDLRGESRGIVVGEKERLDRPRGETDDGRTAGWHQVAADQATQKRAAHGAKAEDRIELRRCDAEEEKSPVIAHVLVELGDAGPRRLQDDFSGVFRGNFNVFGRSEELDHAAVELEDALEGADPLLGDQAVMARRNVIENEASVRVGAGGQQVVKIGQLFIFFDKRPVCGGG